MSIIAELLAQKQRLLKGLESDLGRTLYQAKPLSADNKPTGKLSWLRSVVGPFRTNWAGIMSAVRGGPVQLWIDAIDP
jgi:hypothetical protein